MSACYLDTSALAKWYIDEPGTESFERFVREIEVAVISRLTMVELRCLLARRRRAGDFDGYYERAGFDAFLRDLGAGHLHLHSFHDLRFLDAVELIERAEPVPLRTLDALHLTVAVDAGVESLATADRIMARAADALGMDLHWFGEG